MTNSCICRAPKRCGAGRRIPLFLLAGLAFGGAPALVVTALAQSTASAPARRPIASQIAEASQRFGIPQRWIVAVLQAESAGDVRAVSSAGAVGLMQVMPGTWAELRVRHSLGRDPYDRSAGSASAACPISWCAMRWPPTPCAAFSTSMSTEAANSGCSGHPIATFRRRCASSSTSFPNGFPGSDRFSITSITRWVVMPAVARSSRRCDLNI